MYENEADNETMLVTIGEYKELLKRSSELDLVKGVLKSDGSAYSVVDILKTVLLVE